MKNFFVLALSLVSLNLFAQPFGWNRGFVRNVHDVDTQLIRVNLIDYDVRTVGVDGPELSQCFGKAARDSVKALINLKTVDVLFKGKDSYGRMLAYVRVDGMSLDSIIVAKGWGWNAELYGSHFKQRNDMQNLAIMNNLGLWRYQNNCSPWLFRVFTKNEKLLLCPCE
jgi:micrococcal nuclease